MILLALFLAFASLATAWGLDRRRRVTLDLETVPAAAVSAGRNEVRGRAWHPDPTIAHYSETPCIHWVYAFQERRRNSDSWYWHTLERHDDGRAELTVVDESGSVLVDLEGADQERRPIFLAHVEADGSPLQSLGGRNRYRHIEWGLAVGDPVFVSGEGHVDPDTLEPEIRGGNPLIVSLKPEEDLRVATGWFTVAAAGSALVWFTVAGAQLGSLGGVLGFGIGAGILAIATLVIVHNRINATAQAAARAWSLIDVQLARRHVLIPKLASIARFAGDHERSELENAAADRAARAGSATTPTVEEAENEAASQTGHIRHLLRVVRANPELESQPTMIELERQLADAESRIDGARTFYNHTIERLRTLRSTMPAPLVLRWTDPREFGDFSADGFERTVPPRRIDFESFTD